MLATKCLYDRKRPLTEAERNLEYMRGHDKVTGKHLSNWTMKSLMAYYRKNRVETHRVLHQGYVSDSRCAICRGEEPA